MATARAASSDRIRVSPEIEGEFVGDTPKARLARSFLRLAEALLAEDVDAIDAVALPDVRCHELEALGFPAGLSGLKQFRKQANAAFPDQSVTVAAIQFEADDIIACELHAVATHTGAIMGFNPTGREVRWTIWTRGRFVGGRLAERWDRGDLRQQLSAK